MRMHKQLTSRVAIAMAVAALSGASAFADSRPGYETRDRSGERQVIRRERSAVSPQSRRGNDSNRSRTSASRSDRSRSGGHRQPYYAHGRVSRVSPYRGGYHVWVGGARYPFFVPHAHYHRDRFRVGLMIRLGGYYNPAGYYDYYDERSYSRGALRGVVESVDYRRDTFVVRNDATGSFVTVVSRDRRQNVRPGDYVEVEGEWTRRGLFRAWDVDRLHYDRYR